MEVYLFLEYKFRDFMDSELATPKPVGIIAAFEKLNPERIKQIKRLGYKFGISVTALPGNICPGDARSKNFLMDTVNRALELSPDIIWLDHLRFEGHWEGAGVVKGQHKECRYCAGNDRAEIVSKLGKEARESVPSNIELGYFAVPKKESVDLGQDHNRLMGIFDYVSPMLYNRMIGKPVLYIGEYIKYLSGLERHAKILPVIQLKDMPDDLEDRLSVSEIGEEIRQSLTPPSIGVAVFSWDQAIEKNKLEAVSRTLRDLK